MANTNTAANGPLLPGARVRVYDALGTVRSTCPTTGQIAVDLDGETTWHYWSPSQVVEVRS